MKADKLWEEFCRATGTDEACEYEAWAFGDAPDKLADLVLRGIKTATASAYDFYAADGEPLPKVGEYSVILDSHDDAVCVIRTTRLEVVPFGKVSERHAYLEGEGDRSLAYWRKVHEDFFRRECEEYDGIEFDENFNVLCEEFERLYRASDIKN